MSGPRPGRSWQLRLAAMIAVAIFLGLVARFWHPAYGFTRFLQLDASNDDVKIAAFRKLPLYVYRNTGGYDGLYYAQIAYHPTLADPELAPAMDSLAYRARRILPSLIAWVLAAGQPSLIVHVYTLLNVFAWLALAWLLWRIIHVTDFTGWMAWAGVLFSAGALGSVRLALTDLLALVILAAGVYAAERERQRTAIVFVAAAGLARETSLLSLCGLIRRPWLSRGNFLTILVSAAPLVLWLLYVRWRVGGWDAGWGNFSFPFLGLLEKLSAAIGAVVQGNPDHVALAWTTLLASVGLCVQLTFLSLRRDLADAWWRVGMVYGAMMICLGTAVWEGFPGAATRVLLPLTLAFNVVAKRTGASLRWLVAGNLSVAAGLLAMLEVPSDPSELGAARSHGVALVATAGKGWYGVERTSRHDWSWNAGNGSVAIKAWPGISGPVHFRGHLRSLAPNTITVTQRGKVLWRGDSGAAKTPFGFSFVVDQGEGQLEFTADRSPVPESDSADARHLAFAVYDVSLSVGEH